LTCFMHWISLGRSSWNSNGSNGIGPSVPRRVSLYWSHTKTKLRCLSDKPVIYEEDGVLCTSDYWCSRVAGSRPFFVEIHSWSYKL
jgi:hypothetical protein